MWLYCLVIHDRSQTNFLYVQEKQRTSSLPLAQHIIPLTPILPLAQHIPLTPSLPLAQHIIPLTPSLPCPPLTPILPLAQHILLTPSLPCPPQTSNLPQLQHILQTQVKYTLLQFIYTVNVRFESHLHEAVHFSLKKDRWAVSGVVVL